MPKGPVGHSEFAERLVLFFPELVHLFPDGISFHYDFVAFCQGPITLRLGRFRLLANKIQLNRKNTRGWKWGMGVGREGS